MTKISGKRKAREVQQKIRICQVSFSPPKKVKKLNNVKSITVSAVLCTEKNPPSDTKAIEWLLLTSLELKSDQSKAFDV